MLGSSNLMMGLTLVLVVCLAVVLGLVLVLLAELYCSVLFRRRNTAAAATADQEAATTIENNPPSPSLANLYAQSVLAAPRNILYPSVTGVAGGDIEKQQQQVPQLPENQENIQDLVYISNPVYDGDEIGRKSRVGGNTPFETPDTSPSRLETEETSSGDDEDGGDGEGEDEITSAKLVVTPSLTPVKKLPPAVNDGDGGSGVGGGDSDCNNGVSSSSSSGTPCTSLSW